MSKPFIAYSDFTILLLHTVVILHALIHLSLNFILCIDLLYLFFICICGFTGVYHALLHLSVYYES